MYACVWARGISASSAPGGERGGVPVSFVYLIVSSFSFRCSCVLVVLVFVCVYLSMFYVDMCLTKLVIIYLRGGVPGRVSASGDRNMT